MVQVWFLPELIGAQVLLAQGGGGDEATVLHFSNSWHYTIFNPPNLTNAAGSMADVSSLAGETVTQASANEETMTISTSAGLTLTTDLRDSAYQGPEAAVVESPAGTIFVIR